MKSKINWLMINLISLAVISLVIAINLNSRLVAEQNTAQDTILNKLNQEYQMQERKKAEALKEAAEMNNVGG